MKRIRSLVSLVLLIVLTGCQWTIAPATETPVPEAVPTIETGEDAVGEMAEQAIVDETYTGPEGLYTVPIPTNWTVETTDAYTVLLGPEENIRVYILTVPSNDIEAAIAQAWRTVDPTFALEPEEVTEAPALGGVERVLSVTYDPGEESEEILAASGQLFEDRVYILLIRAELAALQQRAAQLNIIQSGFTIAGIEEVNLADAEPLPLTAALLADFTAYVEEAMERFAIPGVAVSIVQGDEIVYAEGFGVRQLGESAPITPETRFMIGSTGKTMTTLFMATLVDDGVIEWDTPVVEVLPQFAVADPELTQQITMRNLVCACTGVPRRDLELFFNADELSAEQIIESLRTFEFFTDFGEAFQYSNQLVAVAGYAAAAAAGGEYGDLYERYVLEMNQRVFQPIGMTSTTFSFEEVTENDNYARPHSLAPDATYAEIPLALERIVIPVAPAGAPWSNVLDMGRYLITELNAGVAPNGEVVVSAEALATTWELQIPVSAEASYGLGWFVDDYKGQLLIHHGGNTLGFTSDLAFLPQADIGISVLTNGQVTNAFNQALRFRLFELVFDQAPEADAQATFAFESLRREFTRPLENLTAVDPAAVEPFLGRYTNPALGEVELRLEDETLLLDVGEFIVEVRAQTNEAGEVERYVTYNIPLVGLPIEFTENEAGETTFVLGGGVAAYQFEPVE